MPCMQYIALCCRAWHYPGPGAVPGAWNCGEIMAGGPGQCQVPQQNAMYCLHVRQQNATVRLRHLQQHAHDSTLLLRFEHTSEQVNVLGSAKWVNGLSLTRSITSPAPQGCANMSQPHGKGHQALWYDFGWKRYTAEQRLEPPPTLLALKPPPTLLAPPTTTDSLSTPLSVAQTHAILLQLKFAVAAVAIAESTSTSDVRNNCAAPRQERPSSLAQPP